MRKETSDILAEMAERDRAFGTLYREAARSFGLSETAMWVLYAIASSKEPISQRDLSDSMGMSKQTVNSAVSPLAAKGLVELHAVPGTRNRKHIALTDTGTRLASRTVCRMREAEARAVEALGSGKVQLYIELHDEFIAALRREFEKEAIRHGK